MSEICVVCDNALGNDEARFVSRRGKVAHPDCLIVGYPDAENHRWRFAGAAGAVSPTTRGSVQVAVVRYDGGVLTFAARTLEELNARLFDDYIVEYWEEFNEDEAMPNDAQEAIDAYFDNHETETVNFSRINL